MEEGRHRGRRRRFSDRLVVLEGICFQSVCAKNCLREIPCRAGPWRTLPKVNMPAAIHRWHAKYKKSATHSDVKIESKVAASPLSS